MTSETKGPGNTEDVSVREHPPEEIHENAGLIERGKIWAANDFDELYAALEEVGQGGIESTTPLSPKEWAQNIMEVEEAAHKAVKHGEPIDAATGLPESVSQLLRTVTRGGELNLRNKVAELARKVNEVVPTDPPQKEQVKLFDGDKEDKNPTLFIDMRDIRKRQRAIDEDALRAAKEKKGLLDAIRDNLDDLMPDKPDKKE